MSPNNGLFPTRLTEVWGKGLKEEESITNLVSQ